jgi:oligopeptide/dipeptide ABC transporter ATP-binding protein
VPALLQVRSLEVDYLGLGGSRRPALCGVSLDLNPGEILGLVGESGCGKSTLAQAILNLLPANGAVREGAVWFEGQDLLRLPAERLREIRGAKIGMVFQESSLALHPTLRVGVQIARILQAHKIGSRAERKARVREVLAEVFSGDLERIAASYPHELSGGQRQRVLMAQAMACGPRLLVADEPTASLDSVTQAEIVSLFARLRRERGLAILFVTHNPALLWGFADRLAVLYAGRVVEQGPAEELLRAPRHPYLRGLLAAMPPHPSATLRPKENLAAMPTAGEAFPETGCPFEPRCAERLPECAAREPALVPAAQQHAVACFRCAADFVEREESPCSR